MRAIESFEARKGIPVFIPKHEVEAEVGFSVEYICKNTAVSNRLPTHPLRQDSRSSQYGWNVTIQKSFMKKQS